LGKNGTSELRLRYSGLIVFTTQILGIVTGLIFTLLLTRSMSVGEFGIWTNIFDYIPYFAILNSIIPFWVTRFTARDKEGTIVTGVLSQLFMAIIATLIYLPVIFFISNAIGTSQYILIYLIAAFNVLTAYMIVVFEGALQAIEPHATGYGFIIQEVVKVAVALTIILGFGQVFLGAILALVVAPIMQTIYYIYRLRNHLKEQFSLTYLKQWLKGAPAFLYNIVDNFLLSFSSCSSFTAVQKPVPSIRQQRPSRL
jgi:O-antigen/teichoic acid export membrane protein